MAEVDDISGLAELTAGGDLAKTPPPENSEISDNAIKYYLGRANAAHGYNADLSKWILASLLLINLGPFVLIAKGDVPSSDGITQHALYMLTDRAVCWFIGGAASAIICGLGAWINTGSCTGAMSIMAERALGSRRDFKPTLATWEWLQIVGTGTALIFGIASLLSFLFGAICIAKP